jgi:hypothetical protein
LEQQKKREEQGMKRKALLFFFVFSVVSKGCCDSLFLALFFCYCEVQKKSFAFLFHAFLFLVLFPLQVSSYGVVRNGEGRDRR